jgi:hypothetical protein
MATIPTDECALYVLSIFVDLHFRRPGEALTVTNFMATSNFSLENLVRGLKSAGTQGWIQDAPNGGIVITEAGFKAGNGVIPSDEDCAKCILSVFVNLRCRPGDALPINSFAKPFTRGLFRSADFNRGLAHAMAQKWVSLSNGVVGVTVSGFARFLTRV